MTETLLPCPFCGGEARLVNESHVLMRAQMFYVRCEQCGGSSRPSFNVAAAPALWNTRAAEAAAPRPDVSMRQEQGMLDRCPIDPDSRVGRFFATLRVADVDEGPET